MANTPHTHDEENSHEIDFEHLNQYVQGDISLTKEVFGLFKHQVEMWGRLLDPAADDDSWGSVIHSLKGSAKAVGATGLAERCERAEQLVGETKTAGGRLVAVQDIEFKISRTITEIQRWEYRQKLNEMRSS
ncbi:Hpt domain-containing protein [Litorimonas taeanensis]|nr:Hpt domain-containing protein [Litorimonas taeanensis]